MIRRHFLKILGQISIFTFVFKANTEELVSSELIPVVDPEAIMRFQQMNTVSSAPLSMGPLCSPFVTGVLHNE